MSGSSSRSQSVGRSVPQTGLAGPPKCHTLDDPNPPCNYNTAAAAAVHVSTEVPSYTCLHPMPRRTLPATSPVGIDNSLRASSSMPHIPPLPQITFGDILSLFPALQDLPCVMRSSTSYPSSCRASSSMADTEGRDAVAAEIIPTV